MAGTKYDFTEEQRRKVKNLAVSANIYQQNIRELEAQLLLETDEAKRQTLQNRINDKILKRQAKLDEAAALKASVAKVPVTYAHRAKESAQESTVLGEVTAEM